MPLSEKSHAILEEIATGRTYEQILMQNPAWTCQDIFRAAAEALVVCAGRVRAKAHSVEAIRQEYAKAYDRWDAAQDEQVRQIFRAGKTVKEIAQIMKRQPSGIRSRLVKLGLTGGAPS